MHLTLQSSGSTRPRGRLSAIEAVGTMCVFGHLGDYAIATSKGIYSTPKNILLDAYHILLYKLPSREYRLAPSTSLNIQHATTSKIDYSEALELGSEIPSVD